MVVVLLAAAVAGLAGFVALAGLVSSAGLAAVAGLATSDLTLLIISHCPRAMASARIKGSMASGVEALFLILGLVAFGPDGALGRSGCGGGVWVGCLVFSLVCGVVAAGSVSACAIGRPTPAKPATVMTPDRTKLATLEDFRGI